MSRRATALACALGLGLAAGAGAADTRTVLGGDGELYSIEQGLYGELIGPPQAPEADHSVLALRIRRPDQQDALLAVPATLGPDVESAAALLYEETSESLFVAWEARTNYIHSQILLVGFSGGAWDEPIDVSDTRFSFKSDPRLAVTRDAFEGRDAAGEPVTVKRSALHVVWVEDRAEGLAVVYSPVVLLGGAYAGPSPVYVLTELLAPAPEEELPAPLTELPLPPAIAAGKDDHSVVVGFVHPRSGRLVTADLALLPGDVSSLADGLRAHIINIGHEYDTSDPGELSALADGLRAHIINTGHRLDPGVLSYVADGLRAHIINTGAEYDLSDGEDVQAFGALLRAHIINTGVRLQERGLRRRSPATAALVFDFQPAAEAASHQVRLEAVAARGLQGLEAAGEPVVLLSADGADALIAWEQDGQLRYQESRGEGWSDTRAIALATIGLERALEIVEHRIRNR